MRRLRILSLIFVFFFFIIWARLFYLQVIRGGVLASDARSQYLTEYSILPSRGKIISSDGYPLVANESAYLLYAQPNKLPKKSQYLIKLAEILKTKEASISAKIDKGKKWVPLYHFVNQEQKEKIEKLSFSGLGFEQESKRFYPEGSSSAHLLGFVGKNKSGKPTGYFGLEGYYDEILRGKPGYARHEKDAFGLPIPIGGRDIVDAVDGADIKLNIDRGIQRMVEKELDNGIKKYEATGGSVLVMRPDDGRILAMASRPSYDPSDYSNYDPKLYKNPIIADTYEPGSTFKILVMAAAINENLVKTDTIYNEKGPVDVLGYKIRTWNNKYGGKITMTQILERSSNVGMVFVGKKLGIDNMYRYLINYGFGKKTGIDLQEEVSSTLRPKEKWSEIDLATASFGQGIAVTPIQLVRAVSAIANGGYLVTPRVVDKIIMGDGEKINKTVDPPKQVISSSTASIVTEMMVSAVENGEAKWAKPEGFRIAGKTGTAQVPIKGYYDKEKTIASFVGFAPADNPKFVMLVILREPKSSPWGSETAAPLFFKIARELLVYLNISP